MMQFEDVSKANMENDENIWIKNKMINQFILKTIIYKNNRKWQHYTKYYVLAC